MMLFPDAMDAIAAAELRDSRTYTRFSRIDQASYEHAAVEVPEGILELAGELIGRPLRVVEARLLRFSAGDYTLAHHGYVAEPAIELVLDVSPTAVIGAAVHYRRRGNVVFAVPSAPGVLALVDRGPLITANHTYVSKRFPDAEVVRLVALLENVVD